VRRVASICADERERTADDEDGEHRPEREASPSHRRACGHRCQASHGLARVTAPALGWFLWFL
jgi:hypothetical protein